MNMIQLDSIIALRRLSSKIEDPEVARLAELLDSRFQDIKGYLEKGDARHTGTTEGMCLSVSRFLNDILKEGGFQTFVLQGEIEIGGNSWLEHHVSLVHLSHYWVVVDFSVNQIERYQDNVLLLLLCEPQNVSLRNALKIAYDWWTPN
jgi:hypothetical protein